jgi:cellulose synthase/poly-beta-1,6-N-acetylglucosamine synthase-like glycosyltransferase
MGMRITLLIPCYNEEVSILKSAASWLNQTRQADEIIVVDDCSKDKTEELLHQFIRENDVQNLIVVRTPKNTGNKSSAQEYGLNFVTGDILITTDGDTMLDSHFIEEIEKNFEDPEVAAVGGYVRSLKYNWLTACRALDYAIGQNIDKLAQDYINYLFVIPGAAGAFRTHIFKNELKFDHDVLAEDLDITYKLHRLGYKIKYNRKAICMTQDPSSLGSYINQMRRWFGGGWQCLIKHINIPEKPGMALELSLMYLEGLVFSVLLFVLPFISVVITLEALASYFFMAFIFSLFGAAKERRWDLLFILPQYIFLKYVNAYIYLETFVQEVLLRKKNLVWFKPERIKL